MLDKPYNSECRTPGAKIIFRSAKKQASIAKGCICFFFSTSNLAANTDSASKTTGIIRGHSGFNYLCAERFVSDADLDRSSKQFHTDALEGALTITVAHFPSRAIR